MKNTVVYHVFAAFIMAVLMLTGCSGDEYFYDRQPKAKKPTWTLSTAATLGESVATRALASNSGGLTATWELGEKVYVSLYGEEIGVLTPSSGGASTVLTGEVSGDSFEEGDVLEMIFPKQAMDYTGQVGTLADIAQNYDFSKATVEVTETDDDYKLVSTSNANFASQQAICKFTFKDSQGRNFKLDNLIISTAEGKLVKSATGSTVSYGQLEFAFAKQLANQTVALRNDYTDAKDTYTFISTKDGILYRGTKKANLVNGKYYETSVTMTAATTDLSMVDCAGNVRENRWTANCYMIHTAGDYSLPLVYGNAIKDGATNSDAYTSGGVTSYGVAQTFTNHTGAEVVSPWIKDNGITVGSASLLWQDAPGLVTALYISGDYLVLTVGKDAAEQEGNAVVAVKDMEGDIVWSWHIWVTKQTFEELTSIEGDRHTYRVAPVNLGWVGNKSSGVCTYYQWGRKDAFITAERTQSQTTKTVYDINGNIITGLTYEANDNATIADNIKHPTIFYNCKRYTYTGAQGTPNNPGYYNMWDAKNANNGTNGNASDHLTTTKTIYDPCPPGFCVPAAYCLWFIYHYGGTNFNVDGNGRTWYRGYAGGKTFLPYMGYRNQNDAALRDVAFSSGFYWTALPSGSDKGYCLYFGSSSVSLNSNAQAYGYPIRAVVEEYP